MNWKKQLFVASIVTNILVLVPAIYMIQIYDRILSTFSIETLISISLITIILYAIFSALETTRKFVAIREIDQENMQDLNQYLKSEKNKYEIFLLIQHINKYKIQGFNFKLDFPWIFVFVAIQFIFHFWIGLFSIIIMTIFSVISYYHLNVAEERDIIKKNNEVHIIQDVSLISSFKNLFYVNFIEQFFIKKNNDKNTELNKKQLSIERQTFYFEMGLYFFRLLANSSMLGFSAYLVINDELSPGLIIGSSLILGRILTPLGNVFSFIRMKKEFLKSNTKLGQFENKLHDAKLKAPQKIDYMQIPINKIAKNEITKNNNDDLKITIGQCLLVLGKNGSGKSKFINELISSKHTLVNGISIQSIIMNERKKIIGHAPQQIPIFNGSIRENIAMNDLDNEKLEKCLKLTNCWEFVQKLEDGVDTQIFKDNRVILSPGIMQKINIARALYHEPKIIILDEPDNHLEGEDVMRIIKNLYDIKKEVILIIISHVAAFSKIADKIAIFKDGSLIDLNSSEKILPKILNKNN